MEMDIGNGCFSAYIGMEYVGGSVSGGKLDFLMIKGDIGDE